ncbi:CHASE3 domain-containing protein [Variovorax terrae]|uniref:histidine kinase n=1 Tax=Variovorax terrae TaxID=2923278 RepID=A0A9X2AP82_9BURK|nr:CHASE3 domain-containing protein [Variovorax terrae]MCJ0765124.1 CHASE3 domain-containing protein [Variovorax terrae]
MRWPSIPKMAISLPLAVLAACALVGINETGYNQSMHAVQSISEAQQIRANVNKLLQYMLDAETGQRGYLLTGDPRYLEPYDLAMNDISKNLDALRQFYAAYPQENAVFSTLAQSVSRKLSEMDVSVRLRKKGNEDAWKFVLTTDVGKEQMDLIREQSTKLIAISSQKMELSQEQIAKSLQLSRIGIAMVAMAGLLAFYLYLRQSNALRLAAQQQQQALQQERDLLGKLVRERTASLAELATHLQQVREQERGHLARELHDELGALLTAAKLDVARLKSRVGGESVDVTQRLMHLNDTLNSGIALKRRIIEDLRPSSLANLGLVASLEILAREFGERSGLDITTSFEAADVDEATQLTIYRLVQESLTNIAKYAQARQVEITLLNYGTYVTVSVRDDGQGFDTTRIRPASHGLAGMRHRVEASGGRLSVASSEGRGTHVSATLPKSP